MRTIVAGVLVALLLIEVPVFAAYDGAGGQGAGSQSPSLAGNQVQNQNQVKTLNQGEDLQLQVNTQEQENLEEGTKNMGEVATQVQQLLQLGTTGGIGEQVRTIAQAQNQAQTQIQEQLDKLESKGKLARLLTGTDYSAVKNLKTQLEQNQLRIQQLTQLQNQLINQSDITAVQETIQALVLENTSLQDRISAEEQTRSLFGWLFRLISNY